MKVVLATSHVDAHYMKLSKEALEGMAEQINGDVVPGMGVEHDITIPPMGKFIDANVVQMEDGEFALYATPILYNEESSEVVELPNGMLGRKDIWEDKRPFADKCIDSSEKVEFSYDQTNFETQENLKAFKESLGNEELYEEQLLIRKSLIPDPELVIKLSSTVLAYKTFKPFINQVKDDANKDLINVYKQIRNAIINYAKYCFPKNRPITYVFIMHDEVTREFVVRTTDPTIVIKAIQIEVLSEVLKEVNVFTESFDTQKIQFLYDNLSNKWGFNFLLTNTGEVVGSNDAIKNREKAIKTILNSL